MLLFVLKMLGVRIFLTSYGTCNITFLTSFFCLLIDEHDRPRTLMVWKTIPFVEDKCVSGTDAVVSIVA